MSARGKAWIWGTAVLVIAAACAGFARTVPQIDFESVAGVALGLGIMGCTIWASLWFSKRQRDSRARRVEQFDATMRALAEQTGDRYFPGGAYEHPMIETIHYPGGVRGSRDALSYELSILEDEGSFELVVKVGPVDAKRQRLTARSAGLSASARIHVEQLLEVCDRVEVEEPPWGPKADPARKRELVCGTASAKLDGLLSLRNLGDLVDRSVALASELAAGT